MGNNEQTPFPAEQMKILYETFDATLPRLGPGAAAQTYRALDRLLAERTGEGAGEGPLRVLDVGCGNGAQTLDLARRIDGTIVAVDNHQPYLDELDRRAAVAGLADKIETRWGDMAALDFAPGSFDVVWAEGSIFVVGLADGLRAWRPLLADGGMVAITEMTWLRPDPPAACREFFAVEYPALADAATNLAAMATAGYEVVDHFALPADAWWDDYYLPLSERVETLRPTWAGKPDKLGFLEWVEKEIDVFHRFSQWYGYVFYLMRPVKG